MILGERARVDCLGLSSIHLRWTSVGRNRKLCSITRDLPFVFITFSVNLMDLNKNEELVRLFSAILARRERLEENSDSN